MILSGKRIPKDAAEKIAEILTSNQMLQTGWSTRSFIVNATEGHITEWRLNSGDKFWNADDRWCVTSYHDKQKRVALVEKVNAQLKKLFNQYR